MAIIDVEIISMVKKNTTANIVWGIIMAWACMSTSEIGSLVFINDLTAGGSRSSPSFSWQRNGIFFNAQVKPQFQSTWRSKGLKEEFKGRNATFGEVQDRKMQKDFIQQLKTAIMKLC